MPFWNKTTESEIFIFGDIVETSFDFATLEEKNFAKDFAADLNSCGENVTIHINSNGGDVFTALTVANLIKQSKKNVTAVIEGICASAATLIACSADRCRMAKNALFMIHLPSVFLYDFLDKIQLEKIQTSLAKVESSLIETYKNKTDLDEKTLRKMIEKESWLSAKEAADLNFVDEICEEVAAEIDDKKQLIIFNSVALKKEYFAKAKEKINMDKNFLDKLKEILTGADLVTDCAVENQVRAKEMERIKDLNSLRCENPFVNALVDTAISEGRAAAEVEKYVASLKNVKVENKVADKILALIEDNLNSGAKDVTGSDETQNNANKISADLIAKFCK